MNLLLKRGVRVCVCVCVCTRACVRACMHVCVCVNLPQEILFVSMEEVHMWIFLRKYLWWPWRKWYLFTAKSGHSCSTGSIALRIDKTQVAWKHKNVQRFHLLASDSCSINSYASTELSFSLNWSFSGRSSMLTHSSPISKQNKFQSTHGESTHKGVS